ncbi:oligosaccharide flippase family protein [Paenibacillus borealis]|uniref:oligosaccharide flippase family protein n=1 Tax=Paenibacillus borealis TaxID=160799 RepID=UPI0005A6E298|nr:oligosaccharide flippase family protein [Paenibacillus borealis]
MTRFKKIINNKNTKAGGLYLAGNLFNKAIAFLTIPIFTRLMSTSDFGLVNTYLSWVSILSLIVGLSLGSSIRSAYKDFKNDLEGYVSSIFFLSFLNFMVTSSIIIVITYFFIEELDILLVALCLVQSYMTFVINSIDIKYMMSMDYIKKTLLLALPNVIIVFMSVVWLINIENTKYLGRILPFVIVTSVIGVYYLARSFITGKKLIDKRYWKYAITLSIPLIFHGLSINILATSDRTLLTIFRSSSEAGIYSLVYNLSMVAAVVTASLESVWIPWFNKKIHDGKKEIINQSVALYIEIALVVMVGILMIGPEVLVFMAPQEYWSGNILIPPVVLASFFIFLYSISVNLEYYYKSTKVIATNTIIAALVNLGLNFIFIPKYGALGAAYTTVAAYIISFVIHYRAARKLDKGLFPFRVYIKPIGWMFLSVGLTYVLMDYIVARWSLAIVGFGIYIIFSVKKGRFSSLLK